MKALIRQLEKLLAPIFILAVIAAIGYWFWTSTPSYALSQIVYSFNNHDVETFEKYVDIDRIVDEAIDDIIEGPAKSTTLFKESDKMLGIGIIYLFKSELIDMAKEHIELIVAHHKIHIATNTQNTNNNSYGSMAFAASPNKAQKDNEISDLEVAANLTPRHQYLLDMAHYKNNNASKTMSEYGLSYKHFRGLEYLNVHGSKANLGLKFFSPKIGNTYTIEFLMENTDGCWRIVELSNIPELFNLFSKPNS